MSKEARILRYCCCAVRQGGFIPLAELIKRAFKAVKGWTPTPRTQRKYIKLLIESKTLHVYKKRRGRSFVLIACDIVNKLTGSPCKNRKGISYKEAKDKLNNSTSCNQVKKPKSIKKLERLAWFIVKGGKRKRFDKAIDVFRAAVMGNIETSEPTKAPFRTLKDCHYDNCKVEFCEGHAFNYALRMLHRGIDKADIVKNYEKCLLHFHGLATDAGQTWKPSGVINAAQKL
jgi:hypothetical protein